MGQGLAKQTDRVFDLIAAGNETIDIDVIKNIVRKVSNLDNVDLNVDMLDALNRNKIASKICMSNLYVKSVWLEFLANS